MYKDLKEQCDNLDTVLAEFGYHYEESNGGSENNSRYCIIVYVFINWFIYTFDRVIVSAHLIVYRILYTIET